MNDLLFHYPCPWHLKTGKCFYCAHLLYCTISMFYHSLYITNPIFLFAKLFVIFVICADFCYLSFFTITMVLPNILCNRWQMQCCSRQITIQQELNNFFLKFYYFFSINMKHFYFDFWLACCAFSTLTTIFCSSMRKALTILQWVK